MGVAQSLRLTRGEVDSADKRMGVTSAPMNAGGLLESDSSRPAASVVKRCSRSGEIQRGGEPCAGVFALSKKRDRVSLRTHRLILRSRPTLARFRAGSVEIHLCSLSHRRSRRGRHYNLPFSAAPGSIRTRRIEPDVAAGRKSGYDERAVLSPEIYQYDGDEPGADRGSRRRDAGPIRFRQLLGEKQKGSVR
jgi:hypothetical protein